MDDKRIKPMDEHAEFVVSFVDDSREYRDQFEEMWTETEQNYLVRPFLDETPTTYLPLGSPWEYGNHSPSVLDPGHAILKDPETHQSVMTLGSKVVLAAIGEPGFLRAKPVGEEDLFKAKVTGKLGEHAFRQPGHFWTLLEWLLQPMVYNTGILEASWYYDEQPRNFRSVGLGESGRLEADTETLLVPVYDDIRLSCVAARDFYPDPSETLICRMKGAAKQFRIMASSARDMAERGIYDKEATERAIRARSDDIERQRLKHGDALSGAPQESHPDFMELVGYEYYGFFPFKTGDGIDRRVVTVLNGETVRSKPWPRRLPFFECKYTPRFGSFYGVSVSEIMRYDQDFVDVMKMMFADAVVRSVHGQPVYDRNRGVDVAKLMRFAPNVPIAVDGPPNGAIEWSQYNPNIQPIGAFYSMLKQQMREGGGALGAIQGLGLGSKRFSASEAVQTFEQAADRPEMFVQVVEREFLPELGRYALDLYREFLEPGTDDVQRRVGETEYPVDLNDVLPQYDIEFIGSRLEGGRNQQIQASREIFQASANPLVSQMIPWQPFLKDYFEQIGKPEIGAMVADPRIVQLNMLLTMLSGPGSKLNGNGNGTTPDQAPVGQLPAQAAGTSGVA